MSDAPAAFDPCGHEPTPGASYTGMLRILYISGYGYHHLADLTRLGLTHEEARDFLAVGVHAEQTRFLKSRAVPDPAARVAELERLAADILGRFTKGDGGHRARVGQVQIGKWQAVLDGGPDRG